MQTLTQAECRRGGLSVTPCSVHLNMEDTVRYKFHNFVDALELALDAWYFSRYGTARDRKKVTPEVMSLFIRDVDGWANMFFCTDAEKAMNDINYETLGVTSGKNET